MLKKDSNVFIYLVDDDEFQLKLLQSKFKTSTQFKLRAFTDGESFLEHIIKTTFPKKSTIIVILDYFLKTDQSSDTKNGLEILKHLREINPEISVIMYSVSEDIDVATSAMHHGAVNFIKKNENSFSRIHNTISWIISETSLKRKRKQSRLSFQIFFGLLLVVVATVLVLYFAFPNFFYNMN